jgi:hypothetical protein
MAVADTAVSPDLRSCQTIGIAPEDLTPQAISGEVEETAAIMEFDGGLSRAHCCGGRMKLN